MAFPRSAIEVAATAIQATTVRHFIRRVRPVEVMLVDFAKNDSVVRCARRRDLVL